MSLYSIISNTHRDIHQISQIFIISLAFDTQSPWLWVSKCKNPDNMATRWWKKLDNTCSHFQMNCKCNWQTNRVEIKGINTGSRGIPSNKVTGQFASSTLVTRSNLQHNSFLKHLIAYRDVRNVTNDALMSITMTVHILHFHSMSCSIILKINKQITVMLPNSM